MAQRCRLKDTRTVKVKNKNKDKKLLKSRTGGLGTALLVIISMYQCRSHSTPGPNLQTSFILMASVTVLPGPTYRPYKLTPPLPPVVVRLWPPVIDTLASFPTSDFPAASYYQEHWLPNLLAQLPQHSTNLSFFAPQRLQKRSQDYLVFTWTMIVRIWSLTSILSNPTDLAPHYDGSQ
jgi:hypothetical protein